ncbi:hypothetical protein [Actinacidiphila sp. ITFR-21]|uniref:hypothetical protein n=1 Tax=Actinacidiphila sp. ITFR-21 TaxID=3075199 RepID=UPI00288BE3E5|nr:hypothetical protein [Streptomyces sp. ITFR-21]WNI17679.1 hypothetical protein RLT57_20530 [Streptomyces sp. ITFR-21]WNI17819.1 hypothetical protein RLT57_21245 [Streptomyces sp. ITFR-21]
MRCSTIQSTIVPGDEPCEGTATHLLLGSLRNDEGVREPFRDPVCKPCGESFVRRPALKARLVPLHVHEPAQKFLIIEGHRLVEDSEHGQRCHDCGRTGSIEQFKLSLLHGCPARPESVDHLALTGDITRAERNQRASESARLWYHEAAYVLGMGIEDWRVVHNHPVTAAHFTFRDREYRLKFDLAGYRMFAEKLENRGRPAPERINPEHREDYTQVVFHFHDLINKYESTYFATYTPGREDVILHAPEGAISAVLRIELDGTGTREWRLGVVTDAVCDTFGSIADLTFQTRIYE